MMEITDFTPIFEEIKNADEKTLLVFDIDETLIAAKDKILRPCGQAHLLKMLQGIAKTGDDTYKYLSSITLKTRQAEYSEKAIPLLFEKIKQRSLFSMALTAVPDGEYGTISAMEEWRRKELEAMGIHFQNLAPHKEILRTPHLYYHGILFSADDAKGAVLKSFLEKIPFRPSKVIFVDDMIEHVHTVTAHMQELNVPSTCFHYTGLKNTQETISEEVAFLQLKYLLEKKCWLSDEEALEMLSLD